MPDCKETVEVFLRRELGAWNGLPRGCSRTDLAGWLPFRDGEGIVRLGMRPVEYTFRVLPAPGLEDDVSFYFAADRLAAAGTDYWSFDPEECAALLAALGEPERRLDFHWRQQVIPGGERVWAARGIAAGVIPDTGLITRVTVFPPCTVDEYVDRLHHAETAREFRARE